jgi:hypothetical protein
MRDQTKRLLFPVRGCKRDERVQKIGQELVDNLNSRAAEFVVGDRTGAWVRSAYRFFSAADAEAFARYQAQHQWVSVKRWQIAPTEDLPTNEWNADTCEVVKLVPAEITARLDAMGK